MSPGRSFKRFVVLALVLVAGVLGTLVWVMAPPGLVSDPAALRPWSERAKLLNPAPPTPPTIDSNILDSLTVSTNGEGRLQLTLDRAERSQGELLAWEVIAADDSQRADLGGCSLAIEYLGVAYGPPGEGRDIGYALELEGRFFRPDGTSFAEDDYQRCKLGEGDRKLRYNDGFPAVKVGLRLEGVADFKVLGLGAFDTRTRAPIGAGGLSHGGGKERYAIETSLAIWHPDPIELVLDLAVGPPEVFEFPAKPGAFQAFPAGAVTLVAALEGKERSWNSSGDGRKDTISLLFEEDEREPHCGFVFLCQPDAYPVPFGFELLDTEGRALPPAGGGTTGRMAIKTARCNLSDVATVRLLYYPNPRRLIFRLPALPGLPAANADIANLFDLRLPYVSIRYQHNLDVWIGNVLQLKVDASTRPSYPAGAFPMAFTNVTAADVVEAWMGFHPRGSGARVNPETQTLEVRKSGSAALLERVRKWITGRFN